MDNPLYLKHSTPTGEDPLVVEHTFDKPNTRRGHHSPDDWPAGLSNPARRALAAAGCGKLEDVTRFSAAEVAGMHGMGPKGMRILREALAARGLAFAGEANDQGEKR